MKIGYVGMALLMTAEQSPKILPKIFKSLFLCLIMYMFSNKVFFCSFCFLNILGKIEFTKKYVQGTGLLPGNGRVTPGVSTSTELFNSKPFASPKRLSRTRQ